MAYQTDYRNIIINGVQVDNVQDTIVVTDGSVNNETSLQLIGNNTDNWIDILDQDLESLLINFAGPTAPANAQIGQNWFNTSTGQLATCITSTTQSVAWKTLGFMIISNTQPTVASLGDFWYASAANILSICIGTSPIVYQAITNGNASTITLSIVTTAAYTITDANKTNIVVYNGITDSIITLNMFTEVFDVRIINNTIYNITINYNVGSQINIGAATVQDFAYSLTLHFIPVGSYYTNMADVLIQNLISRQNRNVQPSQTIIDVKGGLTSYFTSFTGLTTGTTGTDYGDMLLMNTYGDPTGGNINGLFLAKNNNAAQQIDGIWHFNSPWTNPNWNAPRRIAYVSNETFNNVTITGGCSITGGLSVDTIVSSSNVTVKGIFSSQSITDNGSSVVSSNPITITSSGTTYTAITIQNSTSKVGLDIRNSSIPSGNDSGGARIRGFDATGESFGLIFNGSNATTTTGYSLQTELGAGLQVNGNFASKSLVDNGTNVTVSNVINGVGAIGSSFGLMPTDPNVAFKGDAYIGNINGSGGIAFPLTGGSGLSRPYINGATIAAYNGTTQLMVFADLNNGNISNFRSSSITDNGTTVAISKTLIAPTAPINTNTTQVATTAFVIAQNYQPNLGFTPVQQGGGVGQLTNKAYIGWTGSRVAVTIDSTNMGNLVTDAYLNNGTLPGSFSGMTTGTAYIGATTNTSGGLLVTSPVSYTGMVATPTAYVGKANSVFDFGVCSGSYHNAITFDVTNPGSRPMINNPGALYNASNAIATLGDIAAINITYDPGMDLSSQGGTLGTMGQIHCTNT